jgi:heat shock protein HslJ
MTDLEQQLRAEFGRQAETTPDAGATEQFALGLVGAEEPADRRWGRWLLPAVAALVLLVPAVTVLVVRDQHHAQPAAAAGVSTDPANLIGIEWVLTSYVGADGVSHPAATGAQQQTLRFDMKGGISFTLDCNDAGGAVTLSPSKLVLGQIAITDVGCGRGDNSMSLLAGPPATTLTWQLADHVLTIASSDGPKLNFAVQTSLFPPESPHSTSITIDEGKRGTADYRLFYMPSPEKNVGFQIEWRDAPGAPWNKDGSAEDVGWTGPQPDWNGGCQPIDLAGERYLAGWATAEAARVSVHTSAGGDVDVPLHKLKSTGGLQVYGGFIGQAPKGSTVSIYDSKGMLLGRPCPFGV